MTWDPDVYLRFSDHRLRPGVELLDRVGDFSPRNAVDLGCGTGALTRLIAARYPNVSVVGIDSSETMLQRAPCDLPNLTWRRQTIEDWLPDGDVGLVFSNAALHWLDDHPRLFGRLGTAIPSGGVLAVQMPDNWDQPTHQVPAAILDAGGYDDVADSLIRHRVAEPADYRRWLGPGLEVDMWTTTYHQILRGPDPVLEWVRGSVLAPVLERLEEPRRSRFLAEAARRYREAYPPGDDDTTVLPFRRLFIVARR